MIKMIVVDLDGTILDSFGKVSEKTKTYLKKLKDNGYVIVAATGRLYASALNATDGAKFINYIISDTGSCIYNTKHKRPLLQMEISKGIATKIINDFNVNYRYIDICDKNNYYRYSSIFDNTKITKRDVADYLKKCKKITHMSISMQTNKNVLDLHTALTKKYSELNIIVMQDSFGKHKWLEILPNKCSKYASILYLANHLKISTDDIICFGDGLNDIEMLQKCSQGIAMKNALSEVKEVADDITKFDNNNDGVIKYLMTILPDEFK